MGDEKRKQGAATKIGLCIFKNYLPSATASLPLKLIWFKIFSKKSTQERNDGWISLENALRSLRNLSTGTYVRANIIITEPNRAQVYLKDELARPFPQQLSAWIIPNL